MELQELKDHIDARLDRIEVTQDRVEMKIDLHADRIVRAETDITWVKGSVKTALTLILTVVGSIITWLLTGVHK